MRRYSGLGIGVSKRVACQADVWAGARGRGASLPTGLRSLLRLSSRRQRPCLVEGRSIHARSAIAVRGD